MSSQGVSGCSVGARGGEGQRRGSGVSLKWPCVHIRPQSGPRQVLGPYGRAYERTGHIRDMVWGLRFELLGFRFGGVRFRLRAKS